MSNKIFLVGLGTIGKRVAEAIRKQDDMELSGIGDIVINYNIKNASEEGVNLYTIPEKMELFQENGIEPNGTMEEGVNEADLVVDSTPPGIGAKNKEQYYEDSDIPILFQGGESAEVAEMAFNSFWNYEEAKDTQFVQVVSCNTTALCRIMYALDDISIKKVRGVLIRRGGDPKQTSRGPLNAIIPKHHIPSHHAEDVQRCIPNLDITTMAIKVPTTLMHVHSLNISLEEAPNKEKIIADLKDTRRIVVGNEEIGNTAKVVEWARDVGRKRYDIPEVVVWPGTIKCEENELWISYAVHQESIVVPENIDAIRATLNIMDEKVQSIEKTDNALGIQKNLSI